jgi:hypothetical protein
MVAQYIRLVLDACKRLHAYCCTSIVLSTAAMLHSHRKMQPQIMHAVLFTACGKHNPASAPQQRQPHCAHQATHLSILLPLMFQYNRLPYFLASFLCWCSSSPRMWL